MELHHESEHGREIPLEIMQDIMLRLPIKDVVRSSCVSKLWRRIVKEPTFRKLHAAGHALAPPASSEALLVSVNREPGRRDEASFFNLSSGMAMCDNVAIPSRYSLANICNGFLCFALDGYDQVPVVVCNPITGETLELPKAPPLSVSEENDGHVTVTHLSHRFVLGFSPPTQEYKMFRLSFPKYYTRGQKTNYVAVYTLGRRDGWHQYSYPSQFCPLHTLPPPVHIDGNLYIPVETGHICIAGFSQARRAARMLVLNVATETRCMYHLPYNYNHYHEAWAEMLADGFELNRQMCLAVNVFDEGHPDRKLQFWVMKPPGELGGKDDDDKLHWDLRYCFDLSGESFTFKFPRGAWLDHDNVLCYRHGDLLYKRDTEGYSLSSNDGLLSFDKKLKLPEAPSASPSSSHSASLPSCEWNICGGYRPSLLSPLSFALPPCHDEKGKKQLFENTLLRVVRQSNKGSH